MVDGPVLASHCPTGFLLPPQRGCKKTHRVAQSPLARAAPSPAETRGEKALLFKRKIHVRSPRDGT